MAIAQALSVELETENLKILIVNQYSYAPFHHGGTRHFMLARELQKAGHKVLIVSTSFFHKSQLETRLIEGESSKVEEIDGVNFLWIRTPSYSGNGISRIVNMIAFAFKVFIKSGYPPGFQPDLIYSSSPQLLSSLAAEFLSKRMKVPHVFEIRDLWPQTFIDLGEWKPYHPWILILDLMQKYLYRNADWIVSTLPLANEYISKKGGNANRISWITNGIQVDSLPDIPPPAPNPKPFIFLHAGAHVISTGLDMILDAAKLLLEWGHADDIEIVFLGDGPEKARQISRASDLKLSNVTFGDPVPKSEIFSKLNKADAFLLTREPSPVHQWGISPHKLADYFAARRPIIFSVDSPWNPVLSEKAGLCADPGDHISLAKAMVKMSSTPYSDRLEMAANGYSYMSKHLEIKKLGEKLENIFSQLFSQRPNAK